MLQLHLSDQQVYCLLRCVLYWRSGGKLLSLQTGCLGWLIWLQMKRPECIMKVIKFKFSSYWHLYRGYEWYRFVSYRFIFGQAWTQSLGQWENILHTCITYILIGLFSHWLRTFWPWLDIGPPLKAVGFTFRLFSQWYHVVSQISFTFGVGNGSLSLRH